MMSEQENKNRSTSATEPKRSWWKEAVIYQLYPHLLKNNFSQLEYIQGLGIDVIWCEHNDYSDILLHEVHKRGLRLIIDLKIPSDNDAYLWSEATGQVISDKMKLWLDKGIDGFRLTSLAPVGKAPELHTFLHEMNKELLSRYDCVSIGDGTEISLPEVYKFVEPERKELNMLYQANASLIRKRTEADSSRFGIGYSLIALKQMFTGWNDAVGKGWPLLYLGDPSHPYTRPRFGSNEPEYRAISAKMIVTFLLTMRGTPWLEHSPYYPIENSSIDETEKKSVLDYVKRLMDIRKKNSALVYGTYSLLDADNPQVFAYLREQESDHFLIVLNFSSETAHITPGINMNELEIVMNNYTEYTKIEPGNQIVLRPFEASVLKLRPSNYESFIDSLNLQS